MASDETPTNPFALALNTQRELLEATTESFEKADVAEERVDTLQSVEVGQTPSEVVYTENKLELVHYESMTDEQNEVPILVIYALINKPFILDLQPDRSVVRRLLEAGHDVYLIDWNEPSRLDQHLTLDDYVNRYIENCVDVVRERSGQDAINVLGYCMGGTMSVMYAAQHPEKVKALGLMAAGLCFDRSGGVLEVWGDEEYYDPEDVTDAFGNMPAEFLDVGFALMDPVANFVSKYVRLYDNLEDEDFVENFARMERWLDEGIDVAGEAYVQFLEDIYQENKLYKNELELDGKPVDVGEIDMPVLQILGEYDHLIPPGASKPFNEVVGSDDVTTIEYPTGHIGLSVSGSSHKEVWPQVAEWFHDRSAPETASVTDVAETAEEYSEGVDVRVDPTVGDVDEVEIEVTDEEGVRSELVERDEERVAESIAEQADLDLPSSDDTSDAEDVDVDVDVEVHEEADVDHELQEEVDLDEELEAEMNLQEGGAGAEPDEASTAAEAGDQSTPLEDVEDIESDTTTLPDEELDAEEAGDQTTPVDDVEGIGEEPAGDEAGEQLDLDEAGDQSTSLEDVEGIGEDATDETATETDANADADVETDVEDAAGGPAAAEGGDLEEVDGIGPTYADRLRDAGIRTVADLADGDAAAVAEAAEVSEERARDWIDQVRS